MVTRLGFGYKLQLSDNYKKSVYEHSKLSISELETFKNQGLDIKTVMSN